MTESMISFESRESDKRNRPRRRQDGKSGGVTLERVARGGLPSAGGNWTEKEKIIEHWARIRHVEKGEAVFTPGLNDDSFYVLSKGSAKIIKWGVQGKAFIIDIVGEGSVFRAGAAGGCGDPDESAVMIEDGVVHCMTRRNYLEFQNALPNLSRELTVAVERRRVKREQRLVSLRTCNSVEGWWGRIFILEFLLT